MEDSPLSPDSALEASPSAIKPESEAVIIMFSKKRLQLFSSEYLGILIFTRDDNSII